MKRSQITSTTPSPSPSSSSFHPSGNDEGTLEVKRTKDETSGSSGSDGATTTTGRCTFEEALECQVCLEVAVSPIYSCNEGGHILCYICHGKLAVPKKCPSCSSQGFQVNAALERQAQKLEYRINCAHAVAGCKEKVLSTDFKTHLNTYCYFRDIKCLAKECNANIKFNEYVAHRQQIHHNSIALQPADGMISKNKIKVSGDPGTNKQWILGFDNKFFLLRTNMSDSIFHIWIVLMGDDKEAMQYFAKISLFGKQKLPGNAASCSWTLPVIPFHEDPVTEREKAKPAFASITRKIFVSMVDTDDTKYLFSMNVEMNKMK